jgi:hypothetical protein
MFFAMQPNATKCQIIQQKQYWLGRQLPVVVIGGDEVGGYLLSKGEARRIAANIAKLSSDV